jgi:excisionase family DNA binding protein
MPNLAVSTMPADDWLTSGEAAARLERSVIRVRQLADSGRLTSIRTRWGRLIDPASVDALLAERAKRTATSAGGV